MNADKGSPSPHDGAEFTEYATGELKRLVEITGGTVTLRVHRAVDLVTAALLPLNRMAHDPDFAIDMRLTANYAVSLRGGYPACCLLCDRAFAFSDDMPAIMVIIRPYRDVIETLSAKKEHVPSMVSGVCVECAEPLSSLGNRVLAFFKQEMFPDMRELHLSPGVGHG